MMCESWILSLGMECWQRLAFYSLLKIQSWAVVESLRYKRALGIWAFGHSFLRKKTDQVQSVFLRQMKTRVRALGPGLQIPENVCMDLLKLNLNLLKTLYQSLVTFRIQPGSLAGHLGLHGACVYLSHFTVSSLKYQAVVHKPMCMFQSPGDYLIVRPRLFLRKTQSSPWGFSAAP